MNQVEPQTAPSGLSIVSAAIDRILAPILDVLDDFGATVLLAGRAMTWLFRPPFRFAQFLTAFDFIGADFWGWCREAGFKRYEVLHLSGPCCAAIAHK